MKYFKISTTYLQKQNYTPSDVIIKWAKRNNKTVKYNRYGTPYIEFYGTPYYYDSWQIVKHKDDTETVIITLVRE